MKEDEGGRWLLQWAGICNIRFFTFVTILKLVIYCTVRSRSQNLNIIHILYIIHSSHIIPTKCIVLNYIKKYHGMSWEGHDVGSTIGDSLLPLSVTV